MDQEIRVLFAVFGEVPGEEEGDEDDEDPDAPPVVFASVLIDGGAGAGGGGVCLGALREVGFAGVGEVAARIEEDFLALGDLEKCWL